MAKLHFYYGTMGAGKSSSLLLMNYNYRKAGFNPLIIKPMIDTRDGQFDKETGWGIIQSRVINDETPALYVGDFNYKSFDKINYNVLLVDEAQFMSKEQIWQLSDIVDKKNIPVVCFGLKTDINGNLFEGSQQLLAIADYIEELKYVCDCGAKTVMHLRYIDGKLDKDGTLVALETGNVTYKSVCRKCWKKEMGR